MSTFLMLLDSFDKFGNPASMPRALRVECPGAMYHLMSRGDQREDIFLDDVDRHDFIKTLAEACQKFSARARVEHGTVFDTPLTGWQPLKQNRRTGERGKKVFVVRIGWNWCE